MGSREAILSMVKAAQPQLLPLPEVKSSNRQPDAPAQFRTVLESIGGKTILLAGGESVPEKVVLLFPDAKRIVSSIASVEQYFFTHYNDIVHHSLQDVDVAIVEAQFAVAENGAIWVTEEDLKIRVLPFICEHLVAVVAGNNIVATMHQAYEKIGEADYGFGAFIAGPSKTADIEQSLVLGAHGPKSMTVFIAAD